MKAGRRNREGSNPRSVRHRPSCVNRQCIFRFHKAEERAFGFVLESDGGVFGVARRVKNSVVIGCQADNDDA